MTYPSFASGDVLTAAEMNAVGLWLVKTQTVGTGVATVEVTSAFSSTYDNYRVTYQGGSGSGWMSLNMQFGVGTTWTATGYNGGAAYINVGAANWQVAVSGGTNFVGGSANTDYTMIALDVLSPNLAKRTLAYGPFVRMDNGQIGHSWIEQAATTQFTSFRFTTSAGTLTGGTIRVYGYKNGLS